MTAALNYTISTLAIIAATLFLIDASRPDGTSLVRWIKILRDHASRVRTGDDHIYAAIWVTCANKKIEHFVISIGRAVITKLELINKLPIGSNVLTILVLSGPFLIIRILTFRNTFWEISFELLIPLTMVHVIFLATNCEENDVDLRQFPVFRLLLEAKRIKSALLLVAAAPFISVLSKTKRNTTVVELGMLRFGIYMICSVIGVFWYAANTILKIPSLGPLNFYVIFPIFGMYFCLLPSVLMLGIVHITAIGSFKINFTKYFANTLIVMVISTYVSIMLLYSSRYGFTLYRELDYSFIIFTNVLFDTLIYWRFKKFVTVVRESRRRKAVKRLVVLADFSKLLFWSSAMSIASVFIGFAFSEQPFTIFQSIKLFLGIHPYTEATYFGWLFWLAHTTFIPISLFAAIPVILLLTRLIKFIYYRIALNISLKENPVQFIIAILCLLIAFRDFFN